MTDLHNRTRDFDGIEEPEVLEIMTGTVAIVRKYASYMFAVSCDAALVEDALPRVSSSDSSSRAMLAAFRSVYGFMCHVGMFALGGLATGWSAGRPRQISYVFERGDDGQKGFRRYLEHIENSPHAGPFLDGYSMSGHNVVGKNQIEGVFHSADLVAWEWSKHVENAQSYPHLKMRKSLSEMIGGKAEPKSDRIGLVLADDTTFLFRHFESDRLQSSVAYFRDVLEATSLEQITSAFERWRATR